MSNTRRQAITAIFACAAGGLAAPAKPDFSGRWRLDPSRSSKEAPADLAETIDHREPVIRIDTEWDRTQPAGVSNGAILAPAVQLKSDGTESSNDVPMGLSLVTKSHWDGDKLVTEWRLNGLDVPLSGTWTRYLTGPTLMVVDSITESSGRRLTARYVFAK
jgi:hypothetical protein